MGSIQHGIEEDDRANNASRPFSTPLAVESRGRRVNFGVCTNQRQGQRGRMPTLELKVD
jgi:hypothetical protein